MRKKLIILRILMIVIVLQFAIFSTSSQALGLSDIMEAGKNFLETGKTGAGSGVVIREDEKTGEVTKWYAPGDVGVQATVNAIYSIVFPLGVAITVIVGGILGIKFMIASAEDKAKVKESMVPYVIGCIVIYGAFGIWRIVLQLLAKIF